MAKDTIYGFDDLKQEAYQVVFEVIGKYGHKPLPELKKIVNRAVFNRLNNLRLSIKNKKENNNASLISKNDNGDTEFLLEQNNDKINSVDVHSDYVMILTEVKKFLTEEEYKMLYSKYFNFMTYEEIGKEMHISRQRVEQLMKVALKKLKKVLDK